MNHPQIACVVTSIQSSTPPLEKLWDTLRLAKIPLYVMGDKKGPTHCELKDFEGFWSLERQLESGFLLAAKLPTGHYARKNLGYLLAIRAGAEMIYETDDDNAPGSSWEIPSRQILTRQVSETGWLNVYNLFTDSQIWPRGLPLSAITSPLKPVEPEMAVIHHASILQGLADKSPDVDAVWRLLNTTEFYFESRPPVFLQQGVWCPFNSQNTWWWNEAFPFLYLPSLCSFRMTDIWRSFIAQRCLWAENSGICFRQADVIQDRNDHNLMIDFEQEIDGYLKNNQIATLLEKLSLQPNSAQDNIWNCYEALVSAKFFPSAEMDLLELWLNDLNAICK